MEGTPSTTANY